MKRGERLPSVREKVPQVSDSCTLYSCASGVTSQSYLSMAILHMGWGIDIIGKVTPKASNGHEYILVAQLITLPGAASYQRLK